MGKPAKRKRPKPEKREFICTYDDCNKSYLRLAHLRRHEDVHVGNFQCTEEGCKKNFKSRRYLKKHIDLIHEKKKPKTYKCSECGEEFNKHNWFTSHQYKHTGVKPYGCPKEGCEKRFLVPSKLKRHMKVHDGYPCKKENCGKTFPTWTSYTSHLKLSHPTIHKCSSCGKQFSHSNNMKSHMEIHKTNKEVFPCPKPDCSRYYFQKRNLNDHLKSYHEKRPFVCSQEHCHKAFKSEADMAAHYSRHYKRVRRKKKKCNPKPSFAEKLAGLAPKKWQLKHPSEDQIESAEEETSVVETDESADESEVDILNENNCGETSQDLQSLTGEETSVVKTDEIVDESEIDTLNENNCDETSQDLQSLTKDESSTVNDCRNGDIELLLSMIEKRKEIGTLSVIKEIHCTPVKV